MEAQAIKCPNCGANATNHQNCEYCGSLLVRFIDKQIALDENKYGGKSVKLKGLEAALRRNLEEQERTYGRNHVRTNIICSSFGLELDVTNPKSQTEVYVPNEYFESSKCTLRISPTYQCKTDEQALVICVRFYEITDKTVLVADQMSHGGEYERFNNYNYKAHERFKNLDIFKLFTLQIDDLVVCSKIGFGTKTGKVYQYYLNFGKDVEGAAAIITQYLSSSFSITSPDSCIIEYKQESVTDEEYKEMVLKAKRKSSIGKNALFVFCTLLVLAGIWMLLDDYIFSGLIMIALNLFLIFYTLKNGGA